MNIIDFEALADIGAKYLDEVHPGWFNKVDIEQLRMNDIHHCVLGQLYGSFTIGLSASDGRDWVWAIDHGFAVRDCECSSYGELTEAWADIIRERVGV